jgi:hypothetical protein
MKCKNKFLLSIILVSICLIFNFYISRHYSHNDLYSDEKLYSWIAHALLKGDNFYIEGESQIDIGYEVTPFYPALVAFTFIFGGENQMNPIILNIIFNCLTIILIFHLAILLTKNYYLSFLIILGFIFYFLLWGYNFHVLMEITTVFFLTLSLYLYSKYFYTGKYSLLYQSCVAFSILCLINNRFIVLFSTFLFCHFLISLINKANFQKSFIIPVLIAFTLISPWFLRQYLVYDQFVFFTPTWNNVVANKLGILNRVNVDTDADNIAIPQPFDYEYYVKDLDERYGQDNQLRGSDVFTPEKYAILVREFNYDENIYLNRAKRYFSLYNKDFNFTAPDDFRLKVPSTIPFKIIQIFILLPMFVFTLIGVLMAFSRKNWLIILFSVLFFAHLFLHVLIHYIDRYRVTVLPILLLISTYSINEILMQSKNLFNLKNFNKSRISQN